MHINQFTWRAAGGLVAMAAVILGATVMAGVPAEASVNRDDAPAASAQVAVPAETILHAATGLCLDASVSQGVRLNTCNGSSYQLWSWNSRTRAVVHLASGLCLDASVSQGVRLVACNGGAYQQWRIFTDWTYEHVASGLYLDGSVSRGVRLNAYNGSAYQTWYW